MAQIDAALFVARRPTYWRVPQQTQGGELSGEVGAACRYVDGRPSEMPSMAAVSSHPQRPSLGRSHTNYSPKLPPPRPIPLLPPCTSPRSQRLSTVETRPHAGTRPWRSDGARRGPTLRHVAVEWTKSEEKNRQFVSGTCRSFYTTPRPATLSRSAHLRDQLRPFHRVANRSTLSSSSCSSIAHKEGRDSEGSRPARSRLNAPASNRYLLVSVQGIGVGKEGSNRWEVEGKVGDGGRWVVNRFKPVNAYNGPDCLPILHRRIVCFPRLR